MKTKDLIGDALDWAVAKCEGVSLHYGLTEDERYSTDWGQGGPIIERERICIHFVAHHYLAPCWAAHSHAGAIKYAATPLVAAMRCYVASKLGETVDIPEEITK